MFQEAAEVFQGTSETLQGNLVGFNGFHGVLGLFEMVCCRGFQVHSEQFQGRSRGLSRALQGSSKRFFRHIPGGFRGVSGDFNSITRSFKGDNFGGVP